VDVAAQRPDDALKLLEEARPILERMTRLHPDAPDYQNRLAETLTVTTRWYIGGRRPDQAEDFGSLEGLVRKR
jgi:hypothetical protein